MSVRKMRWRIKRGSKEAAIEGRRGFVITYRMDDGRFIASYPIMNGYLWPLYPYGLFMSIRAILQHKKTFDA